MAEFKIFYSWQSDLPSKSNRNFIQDILERAAKTATTDTVDVIIDQALRDTTGSPKIDEVIIQKILSCDMFIADISFVGQSFDHPKKDKPRLLPNPNVIFELGIASEALEDWTRILLIANEHYGSIDHLPFDLRQHGCIPYMLSQDANDKPEQRKRLKRKIEYDLQSLIGTQGKRQDKSKPCLELRWSTDLKIKPFKNMFAEIDNRISEATEHENSLVDVTDTLTDLIGGRLHKIHGPSHTVMKEYRYYLSMYIQKLESIRESHNGYFLCGGGHVENTGLSITNLGAMAATNISFIIDLPDWLKVTINTGGTNNLPVPPSVLHDPRSNTYIALLREKFHTYSKQWFKCTDNKIEVENYPDQALHERDHDIPQKFSIVAMPDAPIGVHSLTVKIICTEHGWQDSAIDIEIIDENETI